MIGRARTFLEQQMDKAKNKLKSGWLFFAVIVIGVAARLLVATRGHNFDMDSWRIVTDIVDHDGNVYASTERYNYGPVWFHVLYVLNLLAGHNETVFRYFISGFLSLVDAGIFFILWRKFGKLAASFFFLNPVSIIITGYHSQFDNFALLLGLWAVILFGDDFERPLDRRKYLGLLLLGFSLMTKHVLFAFPLWLAVKQKGLLQKCAVLLVPVACFALGFVPYWAGGKSGIIENVFSYSSTNTEHFYNFFVPAAVRFCFNSRTLWLFMLGLFALIHRRRPALESLLLYTCVLVATAPATTNQYLAIPIAFTAVFINAFTMLYTAVATYHLSVDVNGPHFLPYIHQRCDDIAIYILCVALVWVTWREGLLNLLKICRREINVWLGVGK
jgi:hypothetical protein